MTRLASFASAIALVLAACGQATAPAPSQAPPSAASSAPATSLPPPSPSAPPSDGASPSSVQRPTGPSGGPVVELTLAKMAHDPFVTQIAQTSTQHTTTDTASADFTGTTSGQISGPDVDLTVKATSGGANLASRVVVTGDALYANQRDGPWVVGTRAQAGQTLDQILLALRWMPRSDQLADLGEEMLDGTTVHHLAETEAVVYIDFVGGTNTFESFDLWVLADGTPVLRKATVDGVKGTLASHAVTETRYTGFGVPATIKPPKLPATPAPSKRPARP